ncbi:hypothetical protein L798_12517 [Zootermopsis nevadensis]|uniref:Uncharacterized protein n=1 Tax=Zootermopsis nevadensis TaxID=136037 RepID=A0A067QSR6_ZOONE|nr:hypothetical protein L798_12517 [Zootermopsis nevadensis]
MVRTGNRERREGHDASAVADATPPRSRGFSRPSSAFMEQLQSGWEPTGGETVQSVSAKFATGTKILFFLVVTPCSFVGGNQRSRGTYHLHLQGRRGDKLIRNVGNDLQGFIIQETQSIFSLS